jgi:hypothetical protein
MGSSLKNRIAEMINSKPIFCILFTILICPAAYAQSKVLKAENDYIHFKTKTNFPLKIGAYNRGTIISFNKGRDDIAVSYSNQSINGKTTFTVFIRPAGSGTEGRLRNEFLSSVRSITYINKPGNKIQYNPVEFKKDGYKVNGFRAEINDNNGRSDLLVYECGTWFFKLRVTSQNPDSSEIARLEYNITALFCPTDFVRQAPLNIQANIHIGAGAFTDSLMLGLIMGSALKKAEWAIDNIDSLERISGFPDLYLDLHRASLLESVKFEKDHLSIPRTKSTDDYLTQLHSIIDNGFLDEFIMRQFDMIMIVPQDQKFDFTKYDTWEKTNPVKISLKQNYDFVEYTR